MMSPSDASTAATPASVGDAGLSFGITFDYLCPWARNLNEHVLVGLRSGAPWTVRFVPYSLSQGHVAEEDVPIWQRDNPYSASGILALAAGLIVRDHHDEVFLDAHEALFAARHDRGLDIKDPAVIASTLEDLGVDGNAVVERAMRPATLEQLAREHSAAVDDHEVWGVPTVIGSQRSVFLRVLDRPAGDDRLARQRVDTIVGLVEGEPMLHEFKQTDLAR